VHAILTDYQSASGAGSAQEIEETSKQITDVSLSGTSMAEHFVGRDGTYYALMALGLPEFTEAVQAMPQLAEPVRAELLRNAPKAFSAHDDEASRY
jgi:hypothetical protein